MTYNWVNCKSAFVYEKDGVKATKTCKDLEVNSSSTQVSGRLTDLGVCFCFLLLDQWQQMISRIFGFQVNICESILVSADFKPTSFRDT